MAHLCGEIAAHPPRVPPWRPLRALRLNALIALRTSATRADVIMFWRFAPGELCDLRKAQREALLPYHPWPHLPAMLWRAARSDARLSQRLRIPPASSGA